MRVEKNYYFFHVAAAHLFISHQITRKIGNIIPFTIDVTCIIPRYPVISMTL